jgi:hypothetical protein
MIKIKFSELRFFPKRRLRSAVIVRMVGGLGNQLFCYAAARRLALVNNSELIVDDVSGFERDFTYNRHYQLEHFNIPCRKATTAERLEPFSRLRRLLKRAYNRRSHFEDRRYIQQEGIDFDPRLLQLKPSGTLYLEGYWQSEDYFKDVEEAIRADLKITPPVDTPNLLMATRIQDCISVAIHVRFFDMPNDSGINDAPEKYYTSAVERIETLIPGAHYFIFSDRPDAARARVPVPDDRITCVLHNHGDENAYADLWLMSQCQHFIIANSTFSWWAAWLAENPTKQVIAPGFEVKSLARVTAWGFKGLLPDEWIKL